MNEAHHESIWLQISRYAQRCPSPHNTQPYRIKVIDKAHAEIVFLPRRGLPVGDPLGRFTWLTAGIFVEICSIAAHSLAYDLTVNWSLEPMYKNNDTSTPQIIANITLKKAEEPIPDMAADLILKRHTSRLPYDGSAIPGSLIDEMKAEAAKFGHTFEARSDKESIKWVVELNKQALFHDLDNDSIRKELINWLRFNEHEEHISHDGLSARCLRFSGTLLRSFFFNHHFWTLPGIRTIVGGVYKSTMKGIGTIGWLQGPYVTIEDWVTAGKVMIRLWLIVTKHGYYWHPYGSVITSEEARNNMIKYLQINEESGGKQMVWLLLRLGHSAEPPISERVPLEEVLLCGS